MTEVSVCMSTFDRPALLERTLASISVGELPLSAEVVVADDGSPSYEAKEICSRHRARYLRIERQPVYRNPSAARNVAYKAACGDVIIAQSDDVLHSPGAIMRLVEELRRGTFVIACVYNVDHRMQPVSVPVYEFTGPRNPRPFFFLGAVYRRDLYAVGGNSEDFVAPSYDDEWLALCLTRGLGLRPVFSTRAVGYHQHHEHKGNTAEAVLPSKRLYEAKVRDAERGFIKWEALGGPWTWEEAP